MQCNLEEVKSSREKYEEKNPDFRKKYRENNPEEVKASREKYEENNPDFREKYRERNPEEVKDSQKKYKKMHPEQVIKTNKAQYEKNNDDKTKQIERFRHECHGPIFTCICSMRDLFQRSVVGLKGEIEKKILQENQMHEYLNFDDSLIIKDEIECKLASGDKTLKKLQEGYSLCRTCISYLKKISNAPNVQKEEFRTCSSSQLFEKNVKSRKATNFQEPNFYENKTTTKN